MSNKRKAAPPWRTFAWGVLLSVGLYLLLLVLLTLLVVRGVLGEEGAYPAIAVACGVSSLCGGSMNDKNAYELLAQPDIDGGLIGGASLVPEKFVKIIESANQNAE